MAKYKVYDFLNGLKIPVSQYYGENIQYYKDLTRDYATGLSTLTKGHEGVDFAAITGTKLYVPFDQAVIVRAGNNIPRWSNYGTLIVLWDPVQCVAMWFCHLQSFVGNVGDKLKAGDVFAITNNTGNTKGEHVHVNFCETDAQGDRLNTDNGSLGFLNLMDTNLVEIVPLPTRQPVYPEVHVAPIEPVATTKSISLPLAIPFADSPEDYMGIKKSDFQGMRGKCDKYDVMATAQFPDLQEIDNMKTEMVQQKEEMRQAYEATLNEKNKDILQLTEENKQLTDDKEKILNSWHEDVKKNSPTLDKGIAAIAQVHELEATIRNIANVTNAGKPTEYAIFSKLDTLFRSLDLFKRKAAAVQENIEPDTKPVVTSGVQSFLKILRLTVIVLSISLTLIGILGLAHGDVILAAGR